MNKKMLALQITALLIVSGGLAGVLLYTEVYDDVQSGIVSVLCLSCIKLEPKTTLEFTFETATGQPHSAFVLDNLTKGPVFLAYREDVCAACDDMEPIIQDIFSVYFEKEETFATPVLFDNATVTFIHINIDHASKELQDSRLIYDKDDIGGVPMFTLVTWGYDRGLIKPYYTTAYGKLNLDTDEERKATFLEIIVDGITLYQQNHEGHDIH
jgi:thiol-disulfide isomerase/thioredoxin